MSHKVNYNLLKDLFRIPAISGKEQAVILYIIEKLKKMKISYTIDSVGNIYNVDKVGKPLLSAHMDTVQGAADVLAIKDIQFSREMIVGKGVIGGDDKCGIYIMLELLRKRKKDFNFVFSVEEETGGVGIRSFMDVVDLTHMTYGLVLDRWGSSDILCSGNEYGTQSFEDALTKVGKDFNYVPAIGVFCDADYISDDISCANISVGYYKHHTKEEFVIIEDLKRAVEFVDAVLDNVTQYYIAPEKTASMLWKKGYYEDVDTKDEVSFFEGDVECEFCGKKTDKVYQVNSVFDMKACVSCLEALRDETDSTLKTIDEEEFYSCLLDEEWYG